MASRVGLSSRVVLLSLFLAPAVWGQTVTNVRATQLADKTVEVLYDLTGAVSAGAKATLVFPK